MRRILTAMLVAATVAGVSTAALAQTARRKPGERSITREQYVQRASEAAGRRFDTMDTGHRGILTRAEMRAWRDQRRSARAAAPSGTSAAQ